MLELSDNIQQTCAELQEVARLSQALEIEHQKLLDRKRALDEMLDQRIDAFVRSVLDEQNLAVCSRYFSTGTHEGRVGLEQSGVFPKPRMRLSYVNFDLRGRHIEHLDLLCPQHSWFSSQEVLEREGKLVTGASSKDVTDVPLNQGILGVVFYRSVSRFLALPQLPF